VDSSLKLVTLAKDLNKILMVGHVFRFHPISLRLAEFFNEKKVFPKMIDGYFLNPNNDAIPENLALDWLHIFDIYNYLFPNDELRSAAADKSDSRIEKFLLKFNSGCSLTAHLGFGNKKTRNMEFYLDDMVIKADFYNGKLTFIKDGEENIETFDLKKDEPLKKELETFCQLLRGEKPMNYPGGSIGLKIVDWATKSQYNKSPKHKQPKIAVVGGGIFGTTTAVMLAQKGFVVDLYEKENSIFQAASGANQARIHLGYHYPRSEETAKSSIESAPEFEEFYKEAIIKDINQYYCIAKEGSKTNAQGYLKFCRRNGLPYEKADLDIVNNNSVDLCILSKENLVDINKLKNICLAKLKNPNINLFLNTAFDRKMSRFYDKVVVCAYASTNEIGITFAIPSCIRP